MVHLQGNERLYIDEDLIAYSDRLNSEGVIPRRLDLLLLGFSYAVTQRIPPVDKKGLKRHELVAAFSLGKSQLPVEAVAQWYVRELKEPEIEDEAALLDFICRVAIAGVRELKERWDGRGKAQMQRDMLDLCNRVDHQSKM